MKVATYRKLTRENDIVEKNDKKKAELFKTNDRNI